MFSAVDCIGTQAVGFSAWRALLWTWGYRIEPILLGHERSQSVSRAAARLSHFTDELQTKRLPTHYERKL